MSRHPWKTDEPLAPPRAMPPSVRIPIHSPSKSWFLPGLLIALGCAIPFGFCVIACAGAATVFVLQSPSATNLDITAAEIASRPAKPLPVSAGQESHVPSLPPVLSDSLVVNSGVADEPVFVLSNPSPLDPTKVLCHSEEESRVDLKGDAFTSYVMTTDPSLLATMRQMMTGSPMMVGSTFDRPPTFENMRQIMELDTIPSILIDPQGDIAWDRLTMSFREKGFARHENGSWVRHVGNAKPGMVVELLESHPAHDGSGGRSVKVRSVNSKGPAQFEAIYHFQLPRGACNARVLTNPFRLAYDCPPPQDAPSDAPVVPEMKIRAKPHVACALANLYASGAREGFWVARAEFQNGPETLKNYRVRMRIDDGFADWCEWSTCDLVVPGQTIVHPYFAKLNGLKISGLTDATAYANVEVEYEYENTAGRHERGSQRHPIALLGTHAGVYSDQVATPDTPWFALFKYAPYSMALFATSNDPVIARLAQRLRAKVGDPSESDEKATQYLELAYNVLRSNVRYEVSGGTEMDGLYFQRLKYPRDVLRERAGTCVNTAIFMAALAEAGGLEGLVAIVPGHAFAGAKLPKSGLQMFVETTGCGGGTPETSADFAAMVTHAAQEHEEARQKKMLIVVNLADQRKDGVSPADLPWVPETTLDDWFVQIPLDPLPAGAVPKSEPIVSLRFVDKVSTFRDGVRGLEVKFQATIDNARNVECKFSLFVMDETFQFVKSRDSKASVAADEPILLQDVIVPDTETATSDVSFFLPVTALPRSSRKKSYLFVPVVLVDGRPISIDTPPVEFSYQGRGK